MGPTPPFSVRRPKSLFNGSATKGRGERERGLICKKNQRRRRFYSHERASKKRENGDEIVVLFRAADILRLLRRGSLCDANFSTPAALLYSSVGIRTSPLPLSKVGSRAFGFPCLQAAKKTLIASQSNQKPNERLGLDE